VSSTKVALLRFVRWRSVVWPLLAVETACTPVTGVDWRVERGVIQYSQADPLSLQLPATVTSGVPAAITLRTKGSRYCTKTDRTEVTTATKIVTLEPYDSVYVGNLSCPDIPCDCAHVVSVTFPAAGAVTLRVVGRRGVSPDAVAVDTVLVVQ
jgi:hypothetical protein